MGLLTDAFIATEAELPALRPGVGGPSGMFPTVEGKRIDPLKLATLEAIITTPASDRSDMSAVAMTSSEDVIQEWDDEWVCRLPDSLVAALAGLQPDDLERCAAAWAETEEWRLDGATTRAAVESLTGVIGKLRQLAQQAQREGKLMYLWMSL